MRLFILLPLLVSYSACKKDIYIGALLSLSLSDGGWSSSGTLPAVELALEDTNNCSEILKDYELKMILKDNKCHRGFGTFQFVKLIQDERQIVMLLGGGCSIATETVAEASPNWNIVEVSYGAASSSLSNKQLYPLFVRTIQPEFKGNPLKIELMKLLGWSRIATIRSTGMVFSQTVDHFNTILGNENFSIVTSEVYAENPQRQIANLLDLDVRIIYGMFYEDQARKVFCEAYQQGLYGIKYVWFLPGWYEDNWWNYVSNDITCSPEQIKQAAGNYFATREELVERNLSRRMVNGKTLDDVTIRYHERIANQGYSYSMYYAVAYDAVMSIALTLNKSIDVLQAQGKSLENFTFADNETSALFKTILLNLSFSGMSGLVDFDQNGDRIGLYYFMQYQGNKMVTLGYYDVTKGGLVFYDNRSFYWPDGSPPKDRHITRDELVAVSFWALVCTIVISTCGVIVALVFLVFNVRYQHQRLIKISSPRINVLILVGCCLIYLVIPLYGINCSWISTYHSNIICQVEVWLYNLGFTMLYGSLFAKTWRVHVIFTATTTQKKRIKDHHLLTIVACLLLVDVIINTTWQILDPMKYDQHYFDQDDEGFTRFYIERCTCNHLHIWIGVIFSYKGLLLLFGAFLAWETRNVSYAELNDSRNIAISVYTILLTSVVGIPVMVFIKGLPDFTFAITSLFQYISTSVIIALMFVPKILMLKNVNKTAQHNPRIAALDPALQLAVQNNSLTLAMSSCGTLDRTEETRQ